MSGTPLTLPSASAYQAELDRARTIIPTGKRGAATTTVTKEGLTASVAAKPFGSVPFQVEGWAQKQWGGRGWSYGARATFTW